MVETKKRNDDESIGRFVLDIIIMFAILMGIYYFIFSFFSYQMKQYLVHQCSPHLRMAIV